ncbi:MAG: hypothetical protein ACOC3H_01960 [bacterium]
MSRSTHTLETPGVTMNQIHWRTSELLEVPPVLVVTEYEPVALRRRFAALIDGSRTNDALHRTILAIDREFKLEPHAYVVVLPEFGVEIPIDLRDITDDATRLAAIVYEPRATREVIFEYTQLEGVIADQLASLSRDEAVAAMKRLSADGQEFTLFDRCVHDERFAHTFEDGVYRHNYRYVSARPSST